MKKPKKIAPAPAPVAAAPVVEVREPETPAATDQAAASTGPAPEPEPEPAPTPGLNPPDGAPLSADPAATIAGSIYDVDAVRDALPENFGNPTPYELRLKELEGVDPFEHALGILKEKKRLVRYSSGLWGAPNEPVAPSLSGVEAVAGEITDALVTRLVQGGHAFNAETRFGRPREVGFVELTEFNAG